MNILVIGDSCNDVFRYGKCKRLCPEAPVPVFNPTYTTTKGGMALNVYENLDALDVKVGIITNDLKAVKTRFVDEVSNQMIMRLDEYDSISRIDLTKIKIEDYWDAIIISDYNKGFLDKEDIKKIALFCKNNNILVFLDTKKKIGSWVNNVSFIKINEVEYLQNEGNFDDFKNHLIVTLGGEGAKHYDKTLGTITKYEIVKKAEVRDLSGAGDTFLAGFVVDYIKNGDIGSAIQFANRCASYVVTQKGVVVVDIDKI